MAKHLGKTQELPPVQDPPSMDEVSPRGIAHLPEARAATPTLERMLSETEASHTQTLPSGLHLVRIVQVQGDRYCVTLLDQVREDHYWVKAMPGLSTQLLLEASKQGTPVLLQAGATKVQLVGLLQTQSTQTDELTLEARKVVTIRSGRAALQLRSDGTIELLGTRIVATSRGVMKLLARALRLN